MHVRRKANDEAFKYLRLVRGSGSWDMDQLLTNDHLAELRKDARFQALMPKPADFEKPFVENVNVLGEIRGGSKRSQFGWIARRIGDVDGDVAQDFTTSAPTFTVDGTPAGRVYVYSGKTGALLWMKTGAKNEQLGTGDPKEPSAPTPPPPETSMPTATQTLAIGAPGASGGAGRAYFYSGKTGALLQTLSGDSPGDGFGIGVADAGDLDGDGHADLVVGAWQSASAAPSGGASAASEANPPQRRLGALD